MLELGEVSGLVEACGRIEVHESGFRAERARPAVLLVGRTWSASVAEGSSGSPDCTARRCSRSGEPRSWSNTARGGAVRLIRNRWRSCSSPSTPRRTSSDEGRSGSTSPPPPPPPEPRVAARRILHGRGHAAYVRLLRPAHACSGTECGRSWWSRSPGRSSSAGATSKPWKAPARVERVLADRSKCRVDAVVRARRPVQELHLQIVAISHSGKDLGRATRAVGAAPKGSSTVLGGEDETAAVRTGRGRSWSASVPCSDRCGPVTSRRPSRGRPGGVRKGGRSADSIKVMTLPGPSRTIIVEPIERPEHAPVQPEPEPDPAPSEPEPAEEPAPEPDREKEPARSRA